MVQGPSADTIAAIRNPTAQIASLKQLKNDIVGHEQRKELVVKQGILEPLVEILAAPARAAGKRNSANGVSLQQIPTAWTQEDEARLQATLILGSLASGGLAFVKPIIASRAPRYLLNALSTEVAPRMVTATLQALRNLAVSATFGNENDESSAAHPIETFQTLLKQPSTSATTRQQQKLSAEIITLSADDDPSRALLANGGILDTLASLLVSHSVANKYITYGGSISSLPPPPSDLIVPCILTAISSIIKGSNFRAQCFILSTPIRELLSNADGRIAFGNGQDSQGTADSALPPLHVPIYKSVSFNATSSSFPALGSLQPSERRGAGAFESAEYGGTAEHANQVVSWLVFLARSMKGLDRLAALRLLALVNSAIEADALIVVPRTESLQRARERERQLAMLAIPLAVKLVQNASEDKNAEPISATTERENREIQEQACEVLALLIQGSKELQAAAVEAGAIKRVCPILKQTFDNITIAKPIWNAQPSSNEQLDVPESCRLGPKGLPVEIRHAMLCRRSALEAIAALGKKEDSHRKAIVEAGVVNCIIDSLKPFDSSATASTRSKSSSYPTPKDGNTTAVILAACHAAQSMSRSVSLLRTSLIDAGIAKPIFELLKHSNPEVQIAATDVCCNLLLEFSPMREDLLQAGAIKTLTEHARQAEMGLRLASLWALKHLVLASSKDIKIQCLDELGAGWLVGAIEGEHREAALDISSASTGGVSIIAGGGLSTPNAAGEQVELLNPPTSMDVDEPGEEEDGVDDEEDEDGEVMYDEAVGTHYQASQMRSTLHPPTSNTLYKRPAEFSFTRYLSSVREMEQNPTLQAKRDDTAVQEQALDFVRNMLNGDDCAPMFEHLLRAIGQDKVFSLLSDKLSPIPTSANSAARLNKPVYQPTELILSTVHVLTHIANGSPTHKQMLIAQKQLLANWLPHFNHIDRRVRVISVWAVNSLTWVEDDTDRAGAVQR